MRSFAAAAAGIVVLTSLAACGSSGSDAAKQFAKQGVAKVEAQAFAATKGLTSAHVAGHVRSGARSLALDLSLDSQKNCVGSVTIDGHRMKILRVKGALFLKADLATWSKTTNADAATLRKLPGKWVTGLAAADVTVYEALCDPTHLLQAYPTQAGKDDRVTGTATSGGHQVVTVSGHFGGTAKPVTINVLATAPHYITRLSTTGADLALSAFDQPVQVDAPADEDVVHISQPTP